MQNNCTRHVSRLISNGSFIYIPHSRLENIVKRNLQPLMFNHDKQSMSIRCSCSSAESSFQNMMSFRRKQAKRSVLFELSSKTDIPYVLDACEAYGKIENIIAFDAGKKPQLQVIAEFMHNESVKKLLFDGRFKLKHARHKFHPPLRCMTFETDGKQGNLFVASDKITELSLGTKHCILKQPSSVSEMVMEIYEKEKMSDLSIRLRFLSSVVLQESLHFYSMAFLFGSSVNGFGTDNSDLDIMLKLFPEEVSKLGICGTDGPDISVMLRFFPKQSTKNRKAYPQTKPKENLRAFQKHAVFQIYKLLRSEIRGFHKVHQIAHARMPIVKYEHLNLQCDVSINNMSAVCMTEILFYCGELDHRFRPLVFTIKKWAKEAGITAEDSGSHITNFALSLLVLFFLQSRPVPVFPPLYKLVKLPDPDDHRMCAIEYVNGGIPGNPKSPLIAQNEETLGVLLEEFFRFLTVFPFKERRISVMAGDSNPRKQESPIWIDYPMDESLNVCKNVTPEQLKILHDAAFCTVKDLENLHSDLKITYLMPVLGVSDCIPDRSGVFREFL